MARILLTGFAPFGRWPINSSWQAVRCVRDPRIVSACLPVHHDAAAEEVTRLIAKTRPDAVLLTGLAATPALRLETCARRGVLNLPGPDLRRGRWPFHAARQAIAARGISVRMSANAGAYVCDTTYWAALGSPVAFVAFLHVPPLGTSATAMGLARGLEVMLRCLPARSRTRLPKC